jgi:hypothetical protein
MFGGSMVSSVIIAVDISSIPSMNLNCSMNSDNSLRLDNLAFRNKSKLAA